MLRSDVQELLGLGIASAQVRFPSVRALVADYEAARETLEPYWDAGMKEVRREHLAQWDAYQDLRTSRDQLALLMEKPELVYFRVAEKNQENLRKQLRGQNAAIDAALVKWYGYKALHPANLRQSGKAPAPPAIVPTQVPTAPALPPTPARGGAMGREEFDRLRLTPVGVGR